MQTLGERIRVLRDRRGWSQAEVATRAAVPVQNIARLEQGRRLEVRSDMLRRLALALGCTTDYLVGLSEFVGTGVPEGREKRPRGMKNKARTTQTTFPWPERRTS